MRSTELVWDRNDTATASSGGCLLHAGEDSAWSAPLLLATAAGVSLLDTFAALTRDMDVLLLGYVSQQCLHLDEGTDDVVGITITASISVPSEPAAVRARELWLLATKRAPVLRVLKCAIRFESSIVVLRDTATDAEGGG